MSPGDALKLVPLGLRLIGVGSMGEACTVALLSMGNIGLWSPRLSVPPAPSTGTGDVCEQTHGWTVSGKPLCVVAVRRCSQGHIFPPQGGGGYWPLVDGSSMLDGIS